MFNNLKIQDIIVNYKVYNSVVEYVHIENQYYNSSINFNSSMDEYLNLSTKKVYLTKPLQYYNEESLLYEIISGILKNVHEKINISDHTLTHEEIFKIKKIIYINNRKNNIIANREYAYMLKSIIPNLNFFIYDELYDKIILFEKNINSPHFAFFHNLHYYEIVEIGDIKESFKVIHLKHLINERKDKIKRLIKK